MAADAVLKAHTNIRTSSCFKYFILKLVLKIISISFTMAEAIASTNRHPRRYGCPSHHNRHHDPI